MSLHVVDSIFMVKYVKSIQLINPTDPMMLVPTIHVGQIPSWAQKKTFSPFFLPCKVNRFFPIDPRSQRSSPPSGLGMFLPGAIFNGLWGGEMLTLGVLWKRGWKSHMVSV